MLHARLQPPACRQHAGGCSISQRTHATAQEFPKAEGAVAERAVTALREQAGDADGVPSALRRAAHAGIGSIRCKWGSVQEATALWELMHAVPQGRLEEIGLCRVAPAVLRDQYGFADGTLPPMGASPDGLIRQRQPLPQPSHASAVRPVLLACFV